MASKRIEFVDVAKGIATILVIIGHLSYTPAMIKIWLYTFHIPLFFFLSGFVLNTHKYQNVKEFTLDKLKKSILPYIYLSMITWIFVECINQPITQIGIDSVIIDPSGYKENKISRHIYMCKGNILLFNIMVYY